jgi:hypothetical protein
MVIMFRKKRIKMVTKTNAEIIVIISPINLHRTDKLYKVSLRYITTNNIELNKTNESKPQTIFNRTKENMAIFANTYTIAA